MIFIVSIVFPRLEQKTNLNHIKRYVKIKHFVMMPSEDIKILEFNQYQKSDKVSLFTQILNV